VSGDLPSNLMEIGGLLLSLAGTVIHSQSTLCSHVTLYLIYNSTIHCGVEVTELSTNKQHTLSLGLAPYNPGSITLEFSDTSPGPPGAGSPTESLVALAEVPKKT
jgi:hypothetical protein